MGTNALTTQPSTGRMIFKLCLQESRSEASSRLFSQGFQCTLEPDDLYYYCYYHHHHQGLDFDDMSSFFPREIDAAIQYINLGYGAQTPFLFYSAFYRHFVVFLSFRSFL